MTVVPACHRLIQHDKTDALAQDKAKVGTRTPTAIPGYGLTAPTVGERHLHRRHASSRKSGWTFKDAECDGDPLRGPVPSCLHTIQPDVP